MILLLAEFFGFDAIASEKYTIKINEILPNPSTGEKEFVEFYNYGNNSMDITGWKLKDINLEKKDNKFCLLPKMEIPAKEYSLFFLPDCVSSSIALNNTGDDLNLYDSSGVELLSSVSYTETAQKNYSYSFNGNEWKWTSVITPKKENEFDKIPEPKIYSNEIRINEILPAPDKDEEFIELYNPKDDKEDLSGWILRDASKTGKYTFPANSAIKPTDYLVIYKKDFKFALNNSGAESLTLLDPTEKEVSKINYNSSKKGLSYNFDGISWRWSKFLTPGRENIFNNLPTVSSKRTNKIYVNVYADFSAEGSDTDNDELKYTWDFGDGHKSYKAKTRHKYKKIGKYAATLKVSDGSEDVITNYDIEVIEFPKLKIKITAVSPNPSGADSGNEYITLKNNTKKKVNLKNWSIATGWKKLINHPIRENFEIKAGKSRSLTNEYVSITLNNTKSKIELRNPAGEVVDDIKYKNKDGVPDDAIYEKAKKKWKWIEKEISTIIEESAEEFADIEPEIPAEPIETEQEILETELQANLGKYSIDQQWQKKKEYKLLLTNFNKNLDLINSRGRVLGASTIHAIENYYTFTPRTAPEKHWAMKFLENINFKINSLLLTFS